MRALRPGYINQWARCSLSETHGLIAGAPNRREVIMLGLGIGIGAAAIGGGLRQRTWALANRPVTVWGDSLSAGAGASGAGLAFPAQAAALPRAARDIDNRGVGGQTSTQIAARQGGVPITVDGHVVGAVGISGVKPDQDVQVAKAGVSAITG